MDHSPAAPFPGDVPTLMQVFNTLEIAVAIFDRDLKLIFANDQFHTNHYAETGAFPPGTLFEDVIRTVVELVDTADTGAFLEQMISDARVPTGEDHEITTREGYHFRYRLSPISDGRVVFRLRNVTAQRVSQQLADQRTAQMEAILQSMTEGVIVFDQDLNLVLVNDSYKSMYSLPNGYWSPPGTPLLEMVRLRFAMNFGEDEHTALEKAKEKLAQIVQAARNQQPYFEEVNDGRLVEVRRRFTPEGLLVSIYTDVTERERMIHDLREAAQRYQAVVEDQTEMICRFDRDFRLTFANAAYRAAFERPGQDLIGVRFLDLIPDDQARAEIEAGLRGLSSSSPFLEDTYRETTVGGQETWQTWINRAFFDPDGQVLGYQAVGRDVSGEHEAREALAQAEKLSAMGSLLASVSHELNNPLAIVVGQSQLLEELAADPDTLERAGRIRDAAERCARIVRTFLAMARQKTPNHGAVALQPVIQEAQELVSYTFGTNGIELLQDLPDAPVTVGGDRDQLMQIIVNLLINAQQALSGRPGPRRVWLSLAAGQGDVVLSVRDNGPGVAHVHRAKIFDAFFTTKPEGVGTGIGLALCRTIVENHGGSLELSDPAGGGAAFLVRLPLVAPELGGQSPAEAGAAYAQLPPLDILFVDDEADIVETAREILGKDGHQVITASNGQEALDMIARHDFDVLVSDLRMPVLDGPGLWSAIEEARIFPTHTIGFVTGDALSPDIRGFLDRTRAPLIEKPFFADDLRQLILRLVAEEV